MAHNASPWSKALLHRHSVEMGICSAQNPDGIGRTAEIENIASSVIEETEVLHASLKAGSVAQIVVAMIPVMSW